MKVAIGADHKGFTLKERVKLYLQERGIDVTDVGTHSDESTDYPDYGRPVAEAVVAGTVDLGINICWTGNGMNIVANKIPGVRAVLALNAEMAELGRAHNNANVLSMAARYTPEATAREIVAGFLETEFEGGRHQRRLDKIADTKNASSET